MTTEDRLAALDEVLLTQAENWAHAAAREHATSINLTQSHAKRANCGNLYAETKAGDELRERIRAAEKQAKYAEDQALSIRRQLLGEGPRTRGPGKKPPVAEPPKAVDPATKMLMERAAKKKAEASANGRKGWEARQVKATETAPEIVVPMVDCEACGSTMFAEDAAKHAEVCVG